MMRFQTKNELEALWVALHHSIERECVCGEEDMTHAELRKAVSELREYTAKLSKSVGRDLVAEAKSCAESMLANGEIG